MHGPILGHPRATTQSPQSPPIWLTKFCNPTNLPSMTTVNVHEVKTQLSRLLDRAHVGEEIVIAKAGTPYARLVPLQP